MNLRPIRWWGRLLQWCSVLLFCVNVSAPVSAGSEEWQQLFSDTKLNLDTRYRFEFVDQKGLPKTAKANTIRTRAGFETGRVSGIGVVFDVEWIEGIGRERYNDTINGKVQYPVVADPENFQVDQLYIISKDTIPHTQLKIGRQRIIWDNARFVGNVGFRQTEQTFDAIRSLITALPDTEIEYSYIDEVHRIFGSNSPVGRLGLDAHGVRIQYTGMGALTVTPFALLLDYKSTSMAKLDLASIGVLASGSHALNDNWSLLYSGSVAHQQDYADNPANINLWYYQIEAGIGFAGTKLSAGFEVLEGDRTNAFQTPLATGHKFNGLTDQFLTIPPNGLQDFYLSINSRLPSDGWLADTVVKAGYHQFWADKGSNHYGWEWDAGIFKKIDIGYGTFNVGFQYASYHSDGFSTDTDKLWLTVQFKASAQPFRR